MATIRADQRIRSRLRQIQAKCTKAVANMKGPKTKGKAECKKSVIQKCVSPGSSLRPISSYRFWNLGAKRAARAIRQNTDTSGIAAARRSRLLARSG